LVEARRPSGSSLCNPSLIEAAPAVAAGDSPPAIIQKGGIVVDTSSMRAASWRLLNAGLACYTSGRQVDAKRRAGGGEGLVGAAATRPLDDAVAGSVELCGIAIHANLRRRGLGLRLVTEVADALRAEGAVRLVARLQGDHQPAAALLARAGFAATTDADRQSARTGVGWRYLAL
jgi:GNAT superfamily N-acetyltransferase